MALSQAGRVLKRHVVERHQRATIHSARLDEEAGAVPRMSEGQWVDSCQLVAGVSGITLAILEVWVCESPGSEWEACAVVIQDETYNVPIEQLAKRLTLKEAAHVLGIEMSAGEARNLWHQAMGIVTENLIKRAMREKWEPE